MMCSMLPVLPPFPCRATTVRLLRRHPCCCHECVCGQRRAAGSPSACSQSRALTRRGACCTARAGSPGVGRGGDGHARPGVRVASGQHCGATARRGGCVGLGCDDQTVRFESRSTCAELSQHRSSSRGSCFHSNLTIPSGHAATRSVSSGIRGPSRHQPRIGLAKCPCFPDIFLHSSGQRRTTTRAAPAAHRSAFTGSSSRHTRHITQIGLAG